MFFFAARVYTNSHKAAGYPLSLDFATTHILSKETTSLFLCELIIVLSTALCVPFTKAIQKGWLRYYWTGFVIQQVWQMFILATAVSWACTRGWPWVQSLYLTLRTLVSPTRIFQSTLMLTEVHGR